MKAAAIFATALLSACSPLQNPLGDDVVPGPGDRVRVLGEIKGYNQDDPRIRFQPAGRNVTVAVTTYGGGCHTKGDTQVRVQGLVADITPWDYTAPPNTPCTQPLLSFVHEVTVSFDRAGTGLIRVHGIDASARHAGNMRGDSIVVERTVDVR